MSSSRPLREKSLLSRLGRQFCAPKDPPTPTRCATHLEQVPSPQNRVALGDKRDAFGLRRAEVSWSLHPQEARTIGQFHRFLREDLQAAAIGELESPIGAGATPAVWPIQQDASRTTWAPPGWDGNQASPWSTPTAKFYERIQSLCGRQFGIPRQRLRQPDRHPRRARPAAGRSCPRALVKSAALIVESRPALREAASSRRCCASRINLKSSTSIPGARGSSVFAGRPDGLEHHHLALDQLKVAFATVDPRHRCCVT